MICDRNCKCWHCKSPIAIGDKLYWDFAARHRWCEKCAAEAPEPVTPDSAIASKLGELLEHFKQASTLPNAPAGSGVHIESFIAQMNDRVQALEAEISKKFMDVLNEHGKLSEDVLALEGAVNNLQSKMALLEQAMGIEE